MSPLLYLEAPLPSLGGRSEEIPEPLVKRWNRNGMISAIPQIDQLDVSSGKITGIAGGRVRLCSSAMVAIDAVIGRPYGVNFCSILFPHKSSRSRLERRI